MDWNSPLSEKLSIRLLGSYADTKGWRWLDGTASKFGAALVDWRPTSTTRVRFNLSGNAKTGMPSNRAVYPFIDIPIDLNNDGDTNDIVGGVTEATARHNNTFVPWEWTAQTRNSEFDQRGYYAQASIIQKIGDNVDMNYVFTRTDQTTKSGFREFDTFRVNGVNSAFFFSNRHADETDVHTLNASIRASTGVIRHSLLAGARFSMDKNRRDTFRLRPASSAAERAAVNVLIATGRNIPTQLVASDISSRKLWLDDAPTRQEIIDANYRAGNVGDIHNDITTFYVSDSIAMARDRLRILLGLRQIKIVDYEYNTSGAGGDKRKSRDTGYQIGINYSLSENLVLFANNATAFNPNGVDAITGQYFPHETSNAWEIGFKMDRLFSDKVSGSLSYFNINKDNVVRSDFNSATFVNDIGISDDQSKGVELELFVDWTRNWQTVVGYSHIDAKTVRSNTTALGLALEGAIPEKFSLFTSYSFGQGLLRGLRFGGGAILVDGPVQQYGTSNNRLVFENGYTEINLFARYQKTFRENTIEYGFNVSNLANEFYMRSAGNTSDPRKYSFSVQMEF